jgi:hypothetical protein
LIDSHFEETMSFVRVHPLTVRERGLLNAAAVGVLAAGLLVLVPRVVVALSSFVEALLRTLVPSSANTQEPTGLLMLLALPTIYQLALAVSVLYSYGAGTKGQPEADRNPGLELAALAGALSVAALSTAGHLRPGWAGLALTLPLLLQGAALAGLLPTSRAFALVYLPAMLLFAVAALAFGGQAMLWPDLLLALAIPVLAFAIGRLLRLVRLQCSFGSHATMAVVVGFVLAYTATKMLERMTGLA